MKHSLTYKTLNTMRFLAISSIILLIVVMTIKASAYSFDCEPPSKESFSVEREEENDRNKDSFDKCLRGEGNERDQEKAEAYLKENMARS